MQSFIKAELAKLAGTLKDIVRRALSDILVDAEGIARRTASQVLIEVDKMLRAHEKATSDNLKGFDPFKKIEEAAKKAEKAAEKAAKAATGGVVGQTDEVSGIHFPDPSKIVHQITDAASKAESAATSAIESAEKSALYQVNTAANNAEGALKKGVDALPGEIKKAIDAVLKELEKGALGKLVKVLEITSHAGVSVQLGPVTFAWDDVGDNIAALQGIADDPPTTAKEAIADIEKIAPDTVQVAVNGNLFSSDLGAGFSVTYALQDFLHHAEEIIDTVEEGILDI